MKRVIFLLLITIAPAEILRGAEFKLLSTLGNVSLHRRERSYQPSDGQRLMYADVLQTSDNGGATILANTTIVYLGPHTTVRRSSAGNELCLNSGDLRISNGMSEPLVIVTPNRRTTFGKGIFRVSVRADGTHLVSEVGNIHTNAPTSAVIQANFEEGQTNTTRVESGQELFVPRNGLQGGAATQSPGGDARDTTIDVENLQREAADSASDRVRQQQQEQQTRQQQSNAQRSSQQQDESRRRPPSTNQGQASVSAAFASFAGFSASPGTSASAGLFADAAQSTNEGQVDSFPPDGIADGGPFPGNIHLVTGESRYALSQVQLSQSEADAIFDSPNNADPVYYSIGLGELPTGQVSTDFGTASGPVPNAVAIPGFDAFVLRFEQYGLTDAALDPAAALNNNIGIAGLVGSDPPAPSINGATPLLDERSKLNEGVTFALGEIRLRADGGPNANAFEVAVRRSDQDRLIVKDNGGNDANDLVTPNPDVGAFDDVADPRFQPAAPTVKVPRAGTYDVTGTRYSQLNALRRAAVTTVLADQLHDFARRTGQTRFVVDGKIIDISGFRR